MFIEMGSGTTACILNTDRVLTVTPEGHGWSRVIFANGVERILELTFEHLADAPDFHAVKIYAGNTERTEDVMLNMGHLISATATLTEGVSRVLLAMHAESGAAQLNLRVAMSVPQIAEMLRGTPRPVRSM